MVEEYNMLPSKNFHQGEFHPKNPEKYRGEVSKIYHRSSYEFHAYSWADQSPSVLEWSSENVVVPYFDPVRNKQRRYIVDMWIKYKNRKGEIVTSLIEIKDSKEAAPPKPKKRKDVYLREVATWNTNQAKWHAAQKYAEERGWTFKVITEKSIFK